MNIYDILIMSIKTRFHLNQNKFTKFIYTIGRSVIGFNEFFNDYKNLIYPIYMKLLEF